MPKTILHVDMDAFFASVEQMDHPELKGQPVVVGSPPNERGVVAAASYEARKFGIHSAMPSSEAGRRCPHAIFRPVNMHRYAAISARVFKILERFTPLLEPVSIDEAFMDVTGAHALYGDGRAIAEKIRTAIHDEIGLTASVGVATNKFLAKLASDMNKPDGLTVMPSSPAEIRDFLAPLPVGRVWGVGKVTCGLLEKAGIATIGGLQNIPIDRLSAIVGQHSARHLQRLSWGEDARDIELEYEEKSISREHTFPTDCQKRDKLEHVLKDLVDDVGRRLREAGKYATIVHLKLRWQGFQTITRQKQLDSACSDDFRLRTAAQELFDVQKLIKPVRLIGFGVSGLTSMPTEQLSLFEAQTVQAERREKLSRAVDQIRLKFGRDSIGRAGGAKSEEV
ncbi:MAG TPA: DNA polymerase IV [Verrucomicrobia bacterium]|nr:DNA polymerase IV [Verrucomicrobiota bacterium]